MEPRWNQRDARWEARALVLKKTPNGTRSTVESWRNTSELTYHLPAQRSHGNMEALCIRSCIWSGGTRSGRGRFVSVMDSLRQAAPHCSDPCCWTPLFSSAPHKPPTPPLSCNYCGPHATNRISLAWRDTFENMATPTAASLTRSLSSQAQQLAFISKPLRVCCAGLILTSRERHLVSKVGDCVEDPLHSLSYRRVQCPPLVNQSQRRIWSS